MLFPVAVGLLMSAGSVARAQQEGQQGQDPPRKAQKKSGGESREAGETQKEGAQSDEDASSEDGEKEAKAPPADDLFSGPDLGPLREDFTSLMDDIVRARSRVAVLGRQLFQTKVRVKIDNEAGDAQSLSRIAVELDGAPIYRDDGSSLGEETRRVFDGFAAPGPHVLTLVAEQRARANDAYRYTLNDGFRFEVVRGKLTEIVIVLEDDSGIGEDFPEDEEGQYEVTTRVRVATRELEK